MTVARKIGSLLLILTIGSLLGTLSFTVFLSRTSSDGLFLVASNIEGILSEQLQVNALMIVDGQVDLRPGQTELMQSFENLISALENGGRGTREGQPSLSINDVIAAQNATTEQTMRRVAALLSEGLPVPPAEIHDRASELRIAWNQVKPVIDGMSAGSAGDRLDIAATRHLRAATERMSEASRLLAVAVGNRISTHRQNMLIALASIAVSSMVLFVIGLVVSRRYISAPIEALTEATDRVLKGDFVHRAPIMSMDEIAVLAKRFNAMLDEVNRSVLRYRQLFENATDFLYVADLDGRLQSVNKAAAEMTGYSRDELLKMRFDELAVPDNTDVPTEMRNLKISGGQETTTYELEIVRKDGKRITVENSTRLMFENGRAVAFQGVGRDISDRKKLQEQLRVAQKMEAVGRFAGGIAHDFGNVLTIINGYCALILNRIKKDDPMRSEIEGIQRAGQRAASLIRHLLSFSKGQIFRPRPIRVDAALSEMQIMLERLLGEDIRLIVIVGPDVGTIRIDPAQWEQIIVNLTLNARDSMPSGGRLTIEAKLVELGIPAASDEDRLPPGRYVSLNITDTGHGMTQEVMSQIFEPFFSTKEHGTGLGLSTVYGIVHQAGGRITAESQPHEGSTLAILLPRMEEAVEHTETHATPGNTRGNETILLAEDEEDVRHLIREMLKYSGYTVLEAIDPGHAVQICENRHQKIDLLLTDVVMPHVSGPELAAAVRRIRPKLKVVYMSGYPRDKFEKEGFQTDMIHFIQKPLSSETLMPLIRDVLDGTEKG